MTIKAMSKPTPPHGRVYDKKGFLWAVMYQPSRRSKPHITALYPHGRDAQREVFGINLKWQKQGMGSWHWSVKRFMFYFRGTEIDAYEHGWQRNEKST